MKCSKCLEKAIFNDPKFCKEHFISNVESIFRKTVEKYKLFSKKDKIVVACSGGKDSLSLLYLCNKFYHAEALAVDEGISGYRENTLKDFVNFCKKHKVKYNIISYKDEFGFTLDEMLKILDTKPCSICGVFRRYMLNKHSKKYDIIATGHNMDDEVQSIVMNFLNGNVQLFARLGPKSGLQESEEFVQRVKPFYFLSEKEILAYSYLMNFDLEFSECPNAIQSFRANVRDSLNKVKNEREVKQNIVNNFLKILPKLKKEAKKQKYEIKKCAKCKEPSQREICNACVILDKLKQPLIQIKSDNFK